MFWYICKIKEPTVFWGLISHLNEINIIDKVTNNETVAPEEEPVVDNTAVDNEDDQVDSNTIDGDNTAGDDYDRQGCLDMGNIDIKI